MRIFIFIMMLYSCSPSLQTKKQEIYTFVNSECIHKLDLRLDRNFVYSYNCLGVLKKSTGTWTLIKDTVFLNTTKPNKVEEILSSQYLDNPPNYGILKGSHSLLLNSVRLKAK